MPSTELQQFLVTLQSGDRDAVDEMLRQFEPFLRRIIRLRLIDGRLRRVMDTADVFQSLLKDFLEQHHPSVETLAGLDAYLANAVRYKIQTRLRKERRHAGSLPEECEPTQVEPSAARQTEDQDWYQAIRARLPAQTQLLLDLKAQGLTWPEIAEKVGGRTDALRMQLTRALAPILRQLR